MCSWHVFEVRNLSQGFIQLLIKITSNSSQLLCQTRVKFIPNNTLCQTCIKLLLAMFNATNNFFLLVILKTGFVFINFLLNGLFFIYYFFFLNCNKHFMHASLASHDSQQTAVRRHSTTRLPKQLVPMTTNMICQRM
jgi:hypothetical protein